MKIVFQAFSWENDSTVYDTKTFLNAIESGFDISANHRKIYIVDGGDGFFAGIMLTIKDYKKFAVIYEKEGAIDLKVHEVGDNEKLVEFNYFVFNVEKKLGFYQYHHQSCSLLTFNRLISGLYRAELEKIRTIKAQEFTQRGIKKSDIKTLIKGYENTFKTSIFENAASFEEKLQSLANLLYFDCSLIDSQYVGGSFGPILENTKNFSCRLSFNRLDDNASKVKNLLSTLQLVKPNRAKVTGLDEYGNEVAYKLFSDFRSFGEYDYDDMISSMSLNKKDIKNSILNNKIIVELKHEFNRSFI